MREPKALPARTVAMLAAGLGENSRSRRALSGLRHSLDTLILAHIADRLGLLIWDKKHRPPSFVELLEPKEKGPVREKPGQVVGFATPEAFEAARRRIMGGSTDDQGNHSDAL